MMLLALLWLFSHYATYPLHIEGDTVPPRSVWLWNLSVIHNITGITGKLHAPSNTHSVSRSCWGAKSTKRGPLLRSDTYVHICFVCVCMHAWIWSLGGERSGKRSGDSASGVLGNRLQQVNHTMQPSWFWLRLWVKLNRRWLNPALTGRFGLLADYGTSDHHMIM